MVEQTLFLNSSLEMEVEPLQLLLERVGSQNFSVLSGSLQLSCTLKNLDLLVISKTLSYLFFQLQLHSLESYKWLEITQELASTPLWPFLNLSCVEYTQIQTIARNISYFTPQLPLLEDSRLVCLL